LNPQVIIGNTFQDKRGIVSFCNDFNLTPVKRFYQILHETTATIRAWQGHQKESKWFYCVQGHFIINFVKPDNWDKGSGDETVEAIELSSQHPQVLYIPPQYATGIKAISPNSILMIYSDFTLDESKNDDFRFDLDTWKFKVKI
jgi:dTDP-4-dehydrorhamnose 3,5-epimerase-like enzyme